MNIELSPETQARVDQILAGGDYASAEDVVAEAIRLLATRTDAFWADVNQKVAEGVAQLDAGMEIPWSPELFDRIVEGGRRQLGPDA